MKERLITLALALSALAFFYSLSRPAPRVSEEQFTAPLSKETGPNGYAAMYRWLTAESVRVASFRQRYNKLPKQATGDVLLTTMPHRLSARKSEVDALQLWIESGNTLVVMAALADTPDWAMQPDYRGDLVSSLHSLTGLKFTPAAAEGDSEEEQAPNESEKNKAKDGKDKEKTSSRNDKVKQMLTASTRLQEAERRTLSPTGKHPFFEGVDAVDAISEFPADDWIAAPDDGSVVLELARRNGTKYPAVWLAPYGRGQIVVCGFGSSFTNKLIGDADNARFLANLVHWSLGSAGQVLLDDAHQGAVDFYDPQKFFGDPRLHRVFWWLLVLWLIFVLGPTRLRATQSQWNPVDISSFVKATGGFIARTVKPSDAGRRAFELFFNDVRRRLGVVQDGSPTWSWLAEQPRVSAHDLRQLQTFYERVAASKRIDLPRLHNLLRRVTRSFL